MRLFLSILAGIVSGLIVFGVAVFTMYSFDFAVWAPVTRFSTAGFALIIAVAVGSLVFTEWKDW